MNMVIGNTVTGRIKKVTQPRDGYLKPSMFVKTTFDDGVVLAKNENISPTITGMAVDYMTRFLLTGDKEEAFCISLKGMRNARMMNANGGRRGDCLLEQITDLDDESIIAACKIVTYDDWYRNPMAAIKASGEEAVNPDKQTIDNIRIMIQRSLSFWDKVGPILTAGFDFCEKDEQGNIVNSGYTDIVSSGDGDYLTHDTMWDFKVLKSDITNKHTLQILMYYIMGKNSCMDIYKNISKLGFFNPRLNAAYVLDAADIPQEVIEAVARDVIGY